MVHKMPVRKKRLESKLRMDGVNIVFLAAGHSFPFWLEPLIFLGELFSIIF